MRPQVEVKVGEKTVRLLFTIEAVSEVAKKINPRMRRLIQELLSEDVNTETVEEIVQIAIRHSEDTVELSELYNYVGVEGMIALSVDLLLAAWTGVKPREDPKAGEQ